MKGFANHEQLVCTNHDKVHKSEVNRPPVLPFQACMFLLKSRSKSMVNHYLPSLFSLLPVHDTFIEDFCGNL